MSSSKVRLKTTSSIDPNFCDGCGTMLPPIPALGDIVCLSCKKATPAEQFDGIESSYTIWFHKRDEDDPAQTKKKKGGANDDFEADGPTVDRQCAKCGYEKMSYATLQLRSADEGQTVFFTCLKCKFKESENS
jgi:DNA-directed RNA polymerase I subunit RPA12